MLLLKHYLEVPTVTTKCGSLPNEIFQHESNKYIAEVGDYKSLATKSIKLLRHHEKRDYYIDLVRNYKKSHVCKKYFELLAF